MSARCGRVFLGLALICTLTVSIAAQNINEDLNLGRQADGTSTARDIHLGFSTTNGTAQSIFDAYLLRQSGPNGGLDLLSEGGGNMTLNTTGTGSIKFGTNRTERMSLDSNGTVSIPGTLSVGGVVASASGLQAGQFLTVGSAPTPTVFLDLGSMPNVTGMDRDVYVGFASSKSASSNAGGKIYDFFFLRKLGLNGDFYALNGGNGRYTLGNSGTGPIVITANGKDRLVIQPTGEVSIGDGPARGLLNVNGEIFAKKVTVTTTLWPDHVFAADYRLPPLSEVADHIHQHGHLPGVPSEKVVINQGISLADMARMQQQKIEELTLYAIQQDSFSKKYQAQLDQQAEEIRQLKNLVRALAEKTQYDDQRNE